VDIGKEDEEKWGRETVLETEKEERERERREWREWREWRERRENTGKEARRN
jgi:hypothetical protein